MIGFKCEQALKLLVQYYPNERQKKPSLFHSIRVGTYLYNHGYSEDIQVAGLLHDVLEDTSIPECCISEYFGEDVFQIVIANSKTKGIEKDIVLEDIIEKCVTCGESALIVKMADVYDNFRFYVKENIPGEVERCKYLSTLIIEHKLKEWKDPIFDLAQKILEYTL